MGYRDCIECIDEKWEAYREKYPEASHCMYCGRYIRKPDYHKKVPVTVVDRSDHATQDKEEQHPAYAQLSFSRGTSNPGMNLYGSAIKHQHIITMRVSRSVKHTSAYHERYYAYSSPMIEVTMSAAQFAEAITSFNMGSGVPVTLHTFHGEHMPKCEEIGVAQKANDDLKEKMHEFSDRIAEGYKKVEEILEKKGTINKSDRKAIANFYIRMVQDLKSNMPFLHSCMTEAYEKTSANAKAEIEAFYLHAVNTLGMKELERIQIQDNADVVEITEYKGT